MRKFIVPALAAVSLAAIATPVAAETVTIEVSHADLDLSQRAGMAELERRVKRAIDSICTRNSRPLHVRAARRECARDLRNSADEQIARLAPGGTVIALSR